MQKRNIYIFLSLILTIFSGTKTFAVEIDYVDGDSLQTAKKGLLDFKIGHWNWNVKGLATYGDINTYKGVAHSHIYYLNDSLATLDEHIINWENQAITYRTYDPANDSYLIVFAQASSSYSGIIKGHWEGDKFIEIETGVDQFGEWTNRMEIYDIKKDSHKAKLVRTYKNGFTITVIAYEATRIK